MRNHKIIYAPASGGNFLREVLSAYIVAVANATDNQQSIFVEGCIEGLHNDVWGIRKNLDQFDLVITFQTLLNDAKLLSNTIATFLNKPVNDKLTQSVEHWQSISNSLINGTR